MSQSKPGRNLNSGHSGAGFLSRWSRRKNASTNNAGPGPDDRVPGGPSTGTNSPAGQVNDQPDNSPTDKDMPDIETLTFDSDYTDFLSPGVSEQLRKLALKKLFHSEVFNFRDGLDEYDDDFTQFEKLGNIMTADMRHQLDLEAQRQAQRMLQQEDPVHDADADDAAASAKYLLDEENGAATSERGGENINTDEAITLTAGLDGDAGLLTGNDHGDESESISPSGGSVKRSGAEPEDMNNNAAPLIGGKT